MVTEAEDLRASEVIAWGAIECRRNRDCDYQGFG